MCYLVEALFDTGPVRFTTNVHTMEYNGVEWLGAGAMLDIELPEEDSTLQVHQCVVSLNGLDPAAISLALNEDIEGRRVTIYVLLYNPDTNVPLGHWIYHRGTVSQVRIAPATGLQ